MGCGGGDKKKEDPKPATTTTQKQDKAPEVKQTKVKPVPSKLTGFGLWLIVKDGVPCEGEIPK